MNPHRNQYGDGHWRGTQPPLGADAQRPSTSGSRPSAAPSSQQDQRLRPWHYAPPPPPPAPPARPAGLPAGSSFPAFGGRPHQGYQGYGYGYHGGYYGAHHGYAYGRPPQLPPPPPSPSPSPASPYLMGNPRRSEEHDRRGLREVHLPWRQGQTRLSPPPPAVDNNGFHYHHPMPADRSHGSSQVLSTTGGHVAGRDPGWVGGSGRGGRDFGGERGGAPAGSGRKRGYEEMAAEPDQPRRRQQQQYQQYEQHQQPPNQPPRLPPRLPPHQPRRDRNVVVPPFSGVLENRAKFGLAQRRRDMIQPGRILFLKHQSSIHQFTCLIYQMGDNHKPGGFTRHDFDKVNRFFNHPVIVMEGPDRKSLVKVATLTSLGGLTPDQKYAEDNFNAEKHGSHRAELFRSDYIEVHHPGVSDAAPLPGGQRQLHLKNGKKLMERSYVNVDGGKTYMVEGQYLVPYQDFGEKDPDYRLEDESMVYLNEQRAKLESEREERDRAKWPTGKAPNERW
ncbi:hypothetical protein IWX49DRAFT_553357 [Phyllosticta citricarpa]|uniref:Uncharacterized protein n=2 Tax=Phyllosticta TaxID=121621 RepID=A0ABR1MQ56_9PEZI